MWGKNYIVNMHAFCMLLVSFASFCIWTAVSSNDWVASKALNNNNSTVSAMVGLVPSTNSSSFADKFESGVWIRSGLFESCFCSSYMNAADNPSNPNQCYLFNEKVKGDTCPYIYATGSTAAVAVFFAFILLFLSHLDIVYLGRLTFITYAKKSFLSILITISAALTVWALMHTHLVPHLGTNPTWLLRNRGFIEYFLAFVYLFFCSFYMFYMAVTKDYFNEPASSQYFFDANNNNNNNSNVVFDAEKSTSSPSRSSSSRKITPSYSGNQYIVAGTAALIIGAISPWTAKSVTSLDEVPLDIQQALSQAPQLNAVDIYQYTFQICYCEPLIATSSDCYGLTVPALIRAASVVKTNTNITTLHGDLKVKTEFLCYSPKDAIYILEVLTIITSLLSLTVNFMYLSGRPLLALFLSLTLVAFGLGIIAYSTKTSLLDYRKQTMSFGFKALVVGTFLFLFSAFIEIIIFILLSKQKLISSSKRKSESTRQHNQNDDQNHHLQVTLSQNQVQELQAIQVPATKTTTQSQSQSQTVIINNQQELQRQQIQVVQNQSRRKSHSNEVDDVNDMNNQQLAKYISNLMSQQVEKVNLDGQILCEASNKEIIDALGVRVGKIVLNQKRDDETKQDIIGMDSSNLSSFLGDLMYESVVDAGIDGSALPKLTYSELVQTFGQRQGKILAAKCSTNY